MSAAQPDDAAEALRAFCERLRRVWIQAGGPPQAALGRRMGLGTSQMSAILAGKIRRMPDWDVVRTVVSTCADHARKERRRISEPTAEQWWRDEYNVLAHRLQKARVTRPSTGQQSGHGRRARRGGLGRAVREWDAFQLGVHRAIAVEGLHAPGWHELTPYLPRAHDARLRDLIRDVHGSIMVILVGRSSTGKTRAALDAVRQCLPDWTLVRPVDGAELIAQIEGDELGPRTVVWLNETQHFLQAGPEVAAALRRLLADPAEPPVVLLGTMWPEYWKALTDGPVVGQRDTRPQARELLLHEAVRVEVPDAFVEEELNEQRDRVSEDLRLRAAMAASPDGRVVQVLAGGPALVQRHEHSADTEDLW